MIEELVPENTTFYTTLPEIYDELTGTSGPFKRGTQLFTTALAVGILLDKRRSSKKTRKRDLFLLSTVRDEKQLLLLEILLRVGCMSERPDERSKEAMDLADGGVEWLWEEYKKLGSFDFPKVLERMRVQSEKRVPEFLELLRAQRWQ